MIKLLLLLFVPLSSYGYDFWLHRFQEYAIPQFTYEKNCMLANKADLEKLWDFNIADKFSGVEIDAYYRSDSNELLIYHGEDGVDPEESFQCFKGYYLIVEDVLEMIKNKYPGKKIWVDLKNKNILGIYAAIKKLYSLSSSNMFFVETQSLAGIAFASYYDIDSSYWIKLRGAANKLENSFFRRSKNNIDIFIAKSLGANYISQRCDKLLAFQEFLDFDLKLNCWNTQTKISVDKIERLEQLNILLVPKIIK